MKLISSSALNLLDRPAPGPDFRLQVEARDFLGVYLPRLTPEQRRTLIAQAEGRTYREIAAQEGISEVAVHLRISKALHRVRVLAGLLVAARSARAG